MPDQFCLRLASDRQEHTQPEGKGKRRNKDRCPTLSLRLVYRAMHLGFKELYLTHKVHAHVRPANQCTNFSRKEHIPLIPKPWYSFLPTTVHINFCRSEL